MKGWVPSFLATTFFTAALFLRIFFTKPFKEGWIYKTVARKLADKYQDRDGD